MARDAVSASDRVAAETYFQYAEHYFRVLNSSTDPQQNGQARPERGGGDNRQNDGRRNDSRNDNRQDRGRHDGRRTTEAQNRGDTQSRGDSGNGEQPSTPAANGEDAPPPQQSQQQPAGTEAQSSQPRQAAPAAKTTGGNGAERAPKDADAQPEPPSDDDCKPASV